MADIRQLIRHLMTRRKPVSAPDRYDRHWGEWWVFVGEFREGWKEDGA